MNLASPGSAIAARSLRQLEAADQLSEEALKLCDLLGIEALQELTIADRDGSNRLVDDLEALIGQLDDDSTAIVRVREATHEAAPLKPIDPARHARRRQHQASAETRWRKTMRRPRDAQCTQRAHLSAVQAESAEHRFLPSGEERPDPAQATSYLEYSHLEFGSSATPAG